jgi:large subunit ribosomal protein L18e
MKTKAQIDKQLEKKNNPELVQTIIEAKKKKNWLEVAGILSSPKANRININLNKLNEKAKEGETIVVPGKVLSQGEISKKIKVVAFAFSEKAKEKILKAKGEVSTISEEIKKNPDAKGIKIIK